MLKKESTFILLPPITSTTFFIIHWNVTVLVQMNSVDGEQNEFDDSKTDSGPVDRFHDRVDDHTDGPSEEDGGVDANCDKVLANNSDEADKVEEDADYRD